MQTKLFKQFNLSTNIVKSSHYRFRKNSSANELLNDIYPFGYDYFHEINPIIGASLLSSNQLHSSYAVTLRDGALLLIDFLMKNLTPLSSLKTDLYIDHRLSKFIPAQLKKKTGVWKLVTNENFKTKTKYKTLFIQGIISDFSLSLDHLQKELKRIEHFQFDEIKIFLPTRKSPFELPWLENHITNETIELVKSFYPCKKLINLKTKDLFETSNWNETYSLDLFSNSHLLADHYINFELLSRGGVVNHIDGEELSDKFFEVDLSFYHKIQFAPLPEVESVFPELLFLKKKSSYKYLAQDPEILSFILETML